METEEWIDISMRYRCISLATALQGASRIQYGLDIRHRRGTPLLGQCVLGLQNYGIAATHLL